MSANAVRPDPDGVGRQDQSVPAVLESDVSLLAAADPVRYQTEFKVMIHDTVFFIHRKAPGIRESSPGACQRLFISAELKNAGAMLLLIVILLVRPQGLLGRAERIG